MEIEYIECVNTKQGLNLIRPLWEKLNERTKTRSQHFSTHYSRLTFGLRNRGLVEKSKTGALRIDLAKDLDTGELIGYCASTISKDSQGKIDSIYVEPNYRQYGIGDNLMKKVLCWMDNLSTKTKMLVVAAGNEEVFTFYSRYNFYPKATILEQVETENSFKESEAP